MLLVDADVGGDEVVSAEEETTMAKSDPAMRRGLSRRTFLGGTAALGGAAALGLPALGGRRSAAARGRAQAAQISMMGWGSPLEKENVDKGLQTFQGQHPDVGVEWIHVPEDYDTKLKTALGGGTPPDVFWTGALRDYVARGVLMDVTDQVAADPRLGAPDYFLQPQESDRATVNERWFGIGSCWVVPHLYYNADLFEQAGVTPPSTNGAEAWTWDQFLETARQLTKDASGKRPDQEGFNADDVQQYGVSWAGTPDYYRNPLIFSNGGDAFTPDYQCKLGEPAALEAMQTIADLAVVHKVAPQAAVLDQLGQSAWQLLASGKVAMLCDGSWALQDIAKLGFRYGAGVLPKLKEPRTQAAAHLHVVHKATENPEAAWQLLAYLSSDDYQLGLCKTGLWLPSHQSLLTPDGLAQWITPGVHPEGYDRIATDYLTNYAKAVYYPAGYEEATQLIESALDPAWIGEMSVQDALESAGAIDEVNRVLGENKERLDSAVA